MINRIKKLYAGVKKSSCRFTALLFCFFLTQSNVAYSDNIGLAIVATGRYIEFVDPLIESAKKHFCTDHEVTFFVFTDADRFAENDSIVYVPQEKLGWPKDSLMRFKMYDDNKNVFKAQDYVFAIDADMLFVDDVGDEILSEHTAVIHACFPDTRGTYETNPVSTAYVGGNEGKYYYTKTFWGGEKDNFLQMANANSKAVDKDLKKDFIAIWQDESHWNRYCIDHYPKVILSPSYSHPEVMDSNYAPKIICLKKNHHEMRR